jgi:hypothetical protein
LLIIFGKNIRNDFLNIFCRKRRYERDWRKEGALLLTPIIQFRGKQVNIKESVWLFDSYILLWWGIFITIQRSTVIFNQRRIKMM